jgi:integrase
MTDKDMSYPPGLAFHGKGWRITKRIPEALLPYYGGKSHLRYPTGTADKRAAAYIAWRWLADTAEEFARIRETGSAAKTIVPAAEISRLVVTMMASTLGADEEGRTVGGEDERHFRDVAYAEIEAGTRRALSDDDLSAVAPIADDWLQSQGYALDPDSEDYRRVLLEFAKGSSRVLQGLKSRRAGEWVDTPPVPAPPTSLPAAGTLMLSAVVASFLGKQNNTRPIFRKLTCALGLFLEFMGDRPVDNIRQAELEDFFTLLCKLPPHWATEKRKRGCTVPELAALGWAQCIAPQTFKGTYLVALQLFLPDVQTRYRDQGFPQHLTLARIKYSGIQKKGQDKQRALTSAEVKRLFNGAECAAFAADPTQVHCYWLPLLGLYTGARVNEVCQLNPQCDIREEDGIWFLEITEDSATDDRVRKSVKTRIPRRVPLHSHLLELGFLTYVERVKAAGHALLFPQWAPKRGKASGTAEVWFRDHIKALGLRDSTPGFCVHGFHTFRHTFLTRADELDVAKAGALTGHAPTGASKSEGGYVGRRGLEKLRGILEQITFDIDPPKPAQ